jgi:vacuolar-type H+-ATPase subunit D/Vma8
LRARLATARRGADLLHRKLRVLQPEQCRHHREAERTAAEWAACCRDADAWLLRAALLGGRRAIAAAVPEQPARIEVTWTVTMGVRHPGAAEVHGGMPADTAALPTNSALVQATDAYRAALRAAARHAVVADAARRLDAEVTATERRLRAVEDRWIPRLTEALREVEIGLEELELAEGSRLRWARGGSRSTR